MVGPEPTRLRIRGLRPGQGTARTYQGLPAGVCLPVGWPAFFLWRRWSKQSLWAPPLLSPMRRGKEGRKIAEFLRVTMRMQKSAVNNIWFWRCFKASFPHFLTSSKTWRSQTLNLKTFFKRDDKESSFIFLQSQLIEGLVGRLQLPPLSLCWIPKGLSGACKWKQSRIISTTSQESCFNISQVTAMTVTDGKAAGTTQLCFTFLSFCLFFFFFFLFSFLLRLCCNRGLLCIEVLDNHSFGKTYCVL